MKTFDSKAEQDFYHRYSDFIETAQDQFFPCIFNDSNGHYFRAKPDFTYKGIFIELKSRKLNGSKTQQHAEERYSKPLPFKEVSILHKLDTQWNHSRFKQGIVARTYPGEFLIVFKDNTPLSTFAINRMAEEEIPWCYESEMLETLEEMRAALTTH